MCDMWNVSTHLENDGDDGIDILKALLGQINHNVEETKSASRRTVAGQQAVAPAFTLQFG